MGLRRCYLQSNMCTYFNKAKSGLRSSGTAFFVRCLVRSAAAALLLLLLLLPRFLWPSLPFSLAGATGVPCMGSLQQVCEVAKSIRLQKLYTLFKLCQRPHRSSSSQLCLPNPTCRCLAMHAAAAMLLPLCCSCCCCFPASSGPPFLFHWRVRQGCLAWGVCSRIVRSM